MEITTIQNARLWNLAGVLLEMFVYSCVCVREGDRREEKERKREDRD